ncbi:hypothetical protein C0995_010311 [Termitomyces sp. Mi166|nr:hypothetical protein C0995_010311 [Termitomyces sp. Mi166\
MAIELELTVPIVVPKTVVNPAPTPVSATSLIQRTPSVPYIADPSSPPMHITSLRVVTSRAGGSLCRISIAKMALFILLIYLSSSTLLLTQEPSQWSVPHNKGKGKAKVMEDDEDEEEAAQKFRKELEDFAVLTIFDDKLLASLLPPLLEYYEEDIGLPRGAVASNKSASVREEWRLQLLHC